MLWPSLIAGFVLGFAGSLHCVGMCGPLSLALPTWHLSPAKKFFSLLFYQSGRIITYTFMGLVLGIAGRGFYIAGVQQWFSVTVGTIVLLSAVTYFIQRRRNHLLFLTSFYSSVQRWIGRVLRSNLGMTGFLLLGLANGLLPCGMVYIAIATALSFSHLHQTVLFMMMFGMGTLPLMMLVAFGSERIKPSLRITFRKAIPYMVAIMGMMLILRGLNLGILFLSPKLGTGAALHAVSCH